MTTYYADQLTVNTNVAELWGYVVSGAGTATYPVLVGALH
jgi:hypothetical protein